MATGRIIRLTLGFAAVAGFMASAPVNAGEVADGRLLAAGCFNCHGGNGNAVGEVMDPLSEVSPKKMYKSMKQYRADTKAGTIMNRIAKGYTDDELMAMRDYFEEHSGKPMMMKK